MAAGNFHTSNLTLILDNNRLQLDGFTKDIMPLDPITDKLRAFKWNVVECDGHDTYGLQQAFNQALAWKLGPTAIIANTIKGKGVSFMENNVKYHGHVPDDATLAQAIAEIEGKIKDLEK